MTHSTWQRRLRWLLHLLVCCCALSVPLPLLAVDRSGAEPKGLYVRNGVLMRQGKPYFGIGANYNTLFSRLLINKGDMSSLKNLELLGKAGIPFVRFQAGGYWPSGQKLYLEDRPEFFRRMDQVVRCAEQNGVGLIPSLFWRVATVLELVGEERSQLGNPDSKSNRFIREYTREMVVRYKDSPAIWGWEFGNEANNVVDLPNAGEHRSKGGTRFGKAPQPPAEVRLTSQQLRTAYISFAKAVRKLDPWRAIDPGTSLPRASAWHNAHEQAWQRDSPAQFFSMLLDLTPDPMDMISVHVYDRAKKLYPASSGIEEIIGLLMKSAAEARKPMFIGEFPTRDRTEAEKFLRAILVNRVPLSAFWVFDYQPQERMMSVDFNNQRSYVLDLVVKANRTFQTNADRAAP